MGWFLYDNGLRHERVNKQKTDTRTKKKTYAVRYIKRTDTNILYGGKSTTGFIPLHNILR